MRSVEWHDNKVRMIDQRILPAEFRLVEYEDYILLKLQDAELPSPRTMGFVEITPEREYVIVTEFLENDVTQFRR